MKLNTPIIYKSKKMVNRLEPKDIMENQDYQDKVQGILLE